MFKVHITSNSSPNPCAWPIEHGSANYQPNFKNNLKVLLAYDEVIGRKVLKVILKSLRVETLAVENGMEAINLFHAGKSFDVILVALEMTEMSGIEVTRKLRSIGVTKTIAGLTVRSVDEVMQEFAEAGGDILLTLPILRATFIKLLEDVDVSLG
ncbi:two-component response regulator ORR42-like [Phoenix dactylifera]|uniref:Two-component response regulator ORR42-like n=1 Tax=Phoenix dactylifera TaxID=42345 RepID=A0A8B7CUI6_PHODC|nr:two-component response regulator ORR42-like [Phoenix dactylifera]